MAVFTLSIRSTAGTPPSRRKLAIWQDCHDSMSFERAQTTARFRLHDSVTISATRSTTSSPSTAPGNSAQSTCACAPAGVSTRRRARIAGTGYVRLQ
jgi:hypothetical protein